VAVVLDGKTFAQDAMVIALGVKLQGQKKILGFVQTAIENEPVCAAFLRALVERGLRGSFVPPPAIRDLRDLTRYRKSLIQERTRAANRLHKVLQDAGG
jgi:transposase-like protein